MSRYDGLIAKYREYLSLDSTCKPVSLNEGNTPLIPINVARNDVQVFAKFEGLNPTGSFKDRGMTVAVSQAVSEGAKAIVCASTGNTSASAAAYAARAGLKALVIIPEGKIASGKLAQAMMHGATIIQIEGNFDQAMEMVKSLRGELKLAIVNSINPYRLQGQKTAAFEVIEQLGEAPDYHFLPVGNAGNVSAYWMGYDEFFELGLAKQRPIMVGYQASGAAPFIHQQAIKNPETIATAIRIGNPQSYDKARHAIEASSGWFGMVSDEEILKAQRTLAAQHGIFCEPASAASYAGLMKELHQLKSNARVVLTLTGHGLKDPEVAKLQHDQCFKFNNQSQFEAFIHEIIH